MSCNSTTSFQMLGVQGLVQRRRSSSSSARKHRDILESRRFFLGELLIFSKNFPRYPRKIPQTPNQRFMFGNSFLIWAFGDVKSMLQEYVEVFQPKHSRNLRYLQTSLEDGKLVAQNTDERITRWWFQIFFIFNPTWGNDPIGLIFFKWVETTNENWNHLKNNIFFSAAFTFVLLSKFGSSCRKTENPC